RLERERKSRRSGPPCSPGCADVVALKKRSGLRRFTAFRCCATTCVVNNSAEAAPGETRLQFPASCAAGGWGLGGEGKSWVDGGRVRPLPVGARGAHALSGSASHRRAPVDDERATGR